MDYGPVVVSGDGIPLGFKYLGPLCLLLISEFSYEASLSQHILGLIILLVLSLIVTFVFLSLDFSFTDVMLCIDAVELEILLGTICYKLDIIKSMDNMVYYILIISFIMGVKNFKN